MVTIGELCPYAVTVAAYAVMRKCSLTEYRQNLVEARFKARYMLCSPTCFESDYSRCPTYVRRGKKTE